MAYIEFDTPWQRVWLDLDNGVVDGHSYDTGYIGQSKRDPGNLYTDETLLQFDISELVGSTISNVDLDITCNQKGSQSSPENLDLFQQNKTGFTVYGDPPEFDDFAQTNWDTLLATLAGAEDVGTYTILNTTALKNYVQSWIDWGKNNDGMIAHVDFDSSGHWLRVSAAKLKVTYTPPILTPWGNKYVIDEDSGLTSCRLMGGVSPDIDDMVIKKISMPIGDNKSENIRLGVYTGGDLDDPAGATLLWDAGQISGSGGNKWYSITHPSGGIAWPKNTNTWLAYKADDGTTDFIFTSKSSRSGDMQKTRGRWQSTSMSELEGTAFEGTVPSGGSFSSFWGAIMVEYEIAGEGDTARRGLYRGLGRGVLRGI